MRWLSAFVVLGALTIASFMAGSAWQERQSDEKAKAFPCSVRYWNPSMGAFVQTSVGDRDCLKLGRSKVYKGVWIDAPIGSDFISEDPTLPKDVSLSLSSETHAEIYRQAGIQRNPVQPHRFEVTVSGRFGQHNSQLIFIDSSPNRIVVDKVLAARPLRFPARSER